MNKSSANHDTSNQLVSDRETVTVCDNIAALSIDGAPEATGVTSFVQEACEQVDVLGKHYVASKLTTLQPDLQDLKEYFRRPRLIAGSTFTINTRGLETSLDVSKTNLLSTFFPAGFSRLQGVFGFRFRLVFTLQVAASAFSQGQACVSFQYNTTIASTTTFLRSAYSATVTNLPHARIDLAETTMVQLSVPFLYQREFLTVNAGDNAVNEWTYGVVAINRLTPIRTGSGNAPTYKMYIHLEDLELIGASPETFVNVSYQAGRPIEKEFEDDAYPYSSTLHSMSKTVSWIAKGVPSLSSIAGPTSWFLGRAAGIVRYLGWSKPLIQEPPMRQMRLDTILEHNVDVPSQAIMVGPMCSNRLRVDPQFAGTDVDEMSLAYVLSQWSQIKYVTMANTDAQGSLIMGVPISPMAMHFSTNRTTAGPPAVGLVPYNSFIPSNVCFWGSCFRQWRGDFEFRFTFAKTKLHAGRVIVYFTPTTTNGQVLIPGTTVAFKSPDVTGGPHPFGYSAIFDLKDTNVFTFKVPYIADTPYKDIWGVTGCLNMYVMDPLIASSTISTTVDLLVEVRCSPDFELSIPVGNTWPATVTSTPNFQSGSMISTIAPGTSEMVVGDQFTSVKQLISMPGNTQAVPSNLAIGVTKFSLWPWWQQDDPGNTLPPGPWSGVAPSNWTLSAYAARAYCYVRGSTDYHVYTPSNSTVNLEAYQIAGPGLIPVTASLVPYSNNNISRLTTSQDSMHLRVPAYGRTARYLAASLNKVNTGDNNLSVATNSDSTFFQMARLRASNIGAAATTILINRCAGDDAMLGHYMGPTPLALSNDTRALTGWDVFTNAYQSSRDVYHARTGCVVVDDFEDINGVLVPLDFEKNKQNKEVAPPPTPSRTRSMRPPSPFKVSGDVGVKPDNLSGKLTSLLARAELLPKYANLTAQVAEAVSDALDQQ